jgi:fibronectin type 3 domain-containing protein
VILTWTPPTAPAVGYNVYRSITSGAGYVRINPSLVSTSTYTDTTVQSATTYFYVVTAVSPGNVESVFSNEVVAVIP